MNALKRITVAFAITLISALVSAAPLQPGQIFPNLNIKNQHGQDWHVLSQTRLVIFAAGRKASNLVMEVLAPQPKGFLSAKQAVYLADLSRMPGFITRTFALPSLREQNFDVGVVLDPQTLADVPREDNAVTLIHLQEGRIVSHQYIWAEEHLKAILGL